MFEHISTFLKQENHIFLKNLLFFGGVFFGVFLLSFGSLSLLGFIPTELQRETKDDTVAAKIEGATLKQLGLVESLSSNKAVDYIENGELPYRITASSIDLDTHVEHPSNTSYSVLDTALSKGPVYYPGSGLAGKGNMFIFGHSTSFQIVNNEAYQVFNNIKNLKEGDEIKVHGEAKTYIYRVREVKLVNANTELVDFSNNRDMLTLSTCNSFGQKSDRYIAEADFIGIE